MSNVNAKESVKKFLTESVATVTPELVKSIKRGYTKQNLISDLMSGVIVGILALPLAIAFAIASGVGPEQGLYTAIIAGFTISLLGGSRFQIGGPTGAFIVIVYGIVSQYGYDGLASATLLAGIILIVFGLAKFGAIIKFIPYPVTVGFTAGIAVIIALGQVPNFFGLKFLAKDPADAVGKIKLYVSSFDTVNVYSVIIGVIALAVCILWPKITTKVPGSLIAIIVATVIVKVLGWDDPINGHGVMTIGMKNHIPSGFPTPHLPNISLSMMREVFQPALTIAILGAIESLLSAVVADGMTSTKHRSNTELFGQGVANLLSPMFGGIPATGAIARTATNIRNGAVSPISGLVHAVVLLLIMLVLGKYAEMIPMAALAAVLFQVAFNMCGYRAVIKMFKLPKSDVIVMLVAFFLTVIIDLTVAIEVGVLLAAILFIKRMSEVAEVDAVTDAIRADDEEVSHTEFARQVPKGVVVYELAGSLFFGAVDKFKETLNRIAVKPKILILRMRSVSSIDAAGINMIEDLLNHCKADGTQLLLSGVHAQPVVALTRAGVLKQLGEENALGNIDAALNRARELLGLPVVDASVDPNPTVSWEKGLDKPWLPEESNAAVAEGTPEVIAEKVAEEPVWKLK
ncbi:sulfate permease, SulP family [Fibrobacter sp. UWH9]|uniref:SulP family inorganic anion transporter n=1 Tax=unclassified Fibrobacter TaxID=2634177 RepID=UPI0009148B92|nr:MULTISPECIES: sulfate permease [Fibrobacter]MCQ2100843.1 sulfate permease [Fibrobacter sp.]MCL4101496.1 C4-dicarboxylic acid transporter DauA [Fibrobacter succinogenes]OWV07290.1 sodium-independent anion transporter [Fibrobacter sp. UWH3]SHG80386.1 sulfate permease, SulP family [Fibrobacter sp. UWH9]SHK77834.1 sulfate permease, SulP family [Fibrobacter sp. UWH5]